jgi:signal transduction histidine kinase
MTLGPTLKRHSHRVVVNIPVGIVLYSKPGPLGQVAINLINNAYLHAFESRENGVLTIDAQATADWVNVHFIDNGVGIPAEHLDKLYDAFFSTKIGKGGTGLGMAIVKNLVTKVLGGEIAVQSTLGLGTRFDIRLPLRLEHGDGASVH